MSLLLKIVDEPGNQSPVASDNPHSIYGDVVSVHFRREDGGVATAHLWLREPVKTADVPGYCEVEKYVTFGGTAYVMNESGKTVSSFTARTSGNVQGELDVAFPRDPSLVSQTYRQAQLEALINARKRA